jgi:adenylate kinase family enzyme
VKVHIIGVPSAGKTTLAEGIARRLDVPHHPLDSLAFVDDRWTLRPAGERDAMLAEILSEPDFVTEGGFLGWTEPLFSAADIILWLDPPLPTLVWRHIHRHRRVPRQVPSLLLFQLRMYNRPAGSGPAKDDPDQTRAGMEAALRPWAKKVYRIRRSVTDAEVVDTLRSRG